jgi:hypothetical protein
VGNSEELVGREGRRLYQGVFLHSPFSPTNLELTRAGREVAESSLAPPRPQGGSPQLWEGLRLPLPLLLPLLLLLLP